MKTFFYSLGGAVLAALIVAFFLPGEVRIERSVFVNAPAGVVFDLVDDLEKHPLWTPWGVTGTPPQIVYGHTLKGTGASYFWIGDPGRHGTLTIERSEPLREIRLKWDLASVGKAGGTFTFTPAGDSVEVREVFLKKLGYNPVARYFQPLYRREAEKLFDGSLARLKQAAESYVLP